MKATKIYLMVLVFTILASSVLTSCKKGDDDPVVSLRTRKDRFTNTWTLTRYEKNGTIQDISGSKLMYNVFNNGTLSQTIQGAVFGFPTSVTTNGTWSFLNDDEDVKITMPTDTTIYNIQRLATKELWLKKVVAADTYVYYFDGL